MKKLLAFLLVIVFATSCGSVDPNAQDPNSPVFAIYGYIFGAGGGTSGTAPVLNGLSVLDTKPTSITLSQPTFATAGNPAPTAEAYIGLDGTISVSGSTVSGSIQGPVDVSSGGFEFKGLTGGSATYRIIVVAQNSAGYSVMQIVQSTAKIAPVLNNLSVSGSTGSSITLAQPTLSVAGNPLPTVQAYIGLDGTISVSGSTVLNSVQGPADAASGSVTFNALNMTTTYRIIVVAKNTEGYSVMQIAQSTTGIAPVLNGLVISGSTTTSITLSQPTFSTAGNPSPTVNAYIGLDGTISVSGSTVSNYVQGPVSAASGSVQFNSLATSTMYRIIVVAQNSTGYSVMQINQSTAGIAPVMNALAISGTTSSSITLSQPTFSAAGNPSPTVNAYIGLDGTISVSGSTVSNYVQGPVNAASGSVQFNSLGVSTTYRIIVVAQNSVGYAIMQIVQSTAGIAPVMNALAISGSTSSSITLSQPTFSAAGNPSPTVNAYIGLDGTISVSGSTVSNYVQGPVNAASGSVQFNSLGVSTTYRIIVVAQNSVGYAVMQIVQSTAAQTVATPVFNPAAGTYYSVKSIAISTTTPGATIRYATDGSTPACDSGNVYSAPIIVAFNTTVNAIACLTGWTSSSANASYTISISLNLSDTGQTSCYNNSASQGCGDTVNFPRQDGDYANTPNARSFTGPTQHSTWTNDYTTKDNVTGLIWKSCPEGLSGATCTGSASLYTWDSAKTPCSDLNAINGGAGYAGRTNWRLPNAEELASIVDNSVYIPAINGAYFPNTGDGFWTATPFANDSAVGWYVTFYSGAVFTSLKSDMKNARCVSSGP